MELKEMLNFYKKYIRQIFLITSVFISLGLVCFFFLPITYKATGTIFVSRQLDNFQRLDFTYEGYYARQNASEYAKTVVGVIESVETTTKVLEEQQVPVTENAIRMIERKINAKISAPQVITLEVKDKDPENAKNIWKTLATETSNTSQSLGGVGDNKVSVVVLEEAPVVHQAFRHILVFALIGFFFGFLLSSLYYAFKQYLG